MSDNSLSEYICKLCVRQYATYSSLWNHNKKYHSNASEKIVKNSHLMTMQNSHNMTINNNNLQCKKCNKILSCPQNRWRHEKTCKKENIIEIKHMQETIELLENKVLLLEKKTKKSSTIGNNINGNNINNQINSNNNVNITNIIKLGNEELDSVLSNKDKLKILNKRYMCLDYLIKHVHFNDNYPQFKNIVITNLRDNIGYKYDDISSKFIALSKDELLNDLINERLYDITQFYDSMKAELDPKTSNMIETFIDSMDNEKLKDNKLKDIKILIYNNRELVSIKNKE